MLEKYRLADGTYEYNGDHFDTAADVVRIGMLGFCGCGRSDTNLEFIRDAMLHINRQRDASSKLTEFGPWYQQWKKDGRELFGNEEAEEFFYYWADKEKYTEHGSSIPGWLTGEGEDLLQALQEATGTLEPLNR